MRRTLTGAALALLLSAGTAWAAPLQANKAGSCVLIGATAALLKAALVVANAKQGLGLKGPTALSIDSIVIRSAANTNGGQPLTAGGTTGPIVCTFDRSQISPQVPYAIEPVNPTPANPLPAAPGTMNLVTSQIDTWLQYKRNPTGKTENLICLSAGDNSNCFRISPASP